VDRKKISKSDLGRWLDKIAEEYELVGPTEENDVVQFRPVKSSSELKLEYANSLLPPKSLFFPPVEGLFSYQKRGEEIKLEQTKALEKDRVVVGIRKCDVESLLLLDKVFCEDLVDASYKERRDRTALIALACPTPPRSACFCTSFDIDPLSAEGTDILLTDVGEAYLVDVATERGKELAALSSDLFTSLSEKEARELQPPPVEMPKLELGELGEKLEGMWEDPLWDKLSLPCLGCGICTYVCPTCHCFDIADVGSTSNGVRYRCWDSCMYKDFALMTSGVNPRPTKRERARNRYFHKFSTFPSRYGTGYACVGCGRCLVHCPGGVEITEVMQEILAKEAASE
jgi:sulfhydrogenase subunit beta (sulfur reductase)